MTVEFIGDVWNVCRYRDDILSLPNTSNVYIITLVKDELRTPVYIGYTEGIQWRMRHHKLAMVLRYSINPNEYRIDILYRDYGGGIINNRKEIELIYTHKPVFNCAWQFRKRQRFKTFWKSVGVNKVIYRINKYDNRKPIVKTYG